MMPFHQEYLVAAMIGSYGILLLYEFWLNRANRKIAETTEDRWWGAK